MSASIERPSRHKRIVRQTTTELVLAALRDRILSGEAAPGSPLRQESLADELGVSRIPVREALRLLSAEGLVDTIAHHGAFVSMISKAEVQEFFDIRKRLEPWIFCEAIPNLSEVELKRAEQLVDLMDTVEPERWGSLNWELHETLYRAAGRPAALSVVRTLHEKSERYFRFQIVNVPIRKQAHHEHVALIELCRSGEVDRAAIMLEQHIQGAACQILAIVERILDSNARQ
ncbi:probable transcriptional regulator [Bordetella petrii]|uniref:Probable transcriptional regulator n=1 Tax=Bordetella petrii (strain ATCC BAA-461 / DSM 12804 / CCUG 43448 / CIP 107267 / Se-1111R) TaxID=340100 RepID=A9IDS6_BORPD|nr:probable transcriptional regulator [Bordetella petrii]